MGFDFWKDDVTHKWQDLVNMAVVGPSECYAWTKTAAQATVIGGPSVMW